MQLAADVEGYQGVSLGRQWQVGVQQQQVTSPTHNTLALQGSDRASA